MGMTSCDSEMTVREYAVVSCLAHTSARLTAADVADPRVTRAIDETADVACSIEAARRSVSRDSVAP